MINKGIDQAAKNAVERQILTEKIDLERTLNESLSKLTVSSSHIRTRRQAFLAQAEQAARDLVQAEADHRVAEQAIRDLTQAEADLRVAEQAARELAQTKPIFEQLWLFRRRLVRLSEQALVPAVTIFALGLIVIGGLIMASYPGKGPSAVTQQEMPQQIQPRQLQPGAVSPVSPVQTTLPPHVKKDANDQLNPEDGYDWSDGSRASVRWTPGKLSRQYPHVIASDTEGEWQPDDGYDWLAAAKFKHKSVKWVPGIASTRYPNIVAAAAEGQWRPADGYTWIVYPPRWADIRVVKPIGGPQDQYANPPPIPPLDQGLADRAEWEIWAAALSGDFRRGAEWWAAHRSLANPGACNGPGAAMDQQFILGCEAAKARLIRTDSKRKSNPDYRRGWNSYTGTTTPAPAPDGLAPAIDQVGSAAPNDADADPVKRLNEQELKRLNGQ